MDDLIKQFKNMKIPGGMLLGVIVVLVLAIGYTSFFTIDTGAVGVIRRFGEFVRIAQPGPNFKFPFGIEQVSKIPKKRFSRRSSVCVQIVPIHASDQRSPRQRVNH